ncbi:MAG: 50S ribosomal protein L10 [Candidatus Fermentibacteraceae bacterium]
MAVTRRKKEEIVESLSENFGEAKSFVLTDFTGIDVDEMTELRTKMREAGVSYTVAKNTLLRMIFDNVGIPEGEKFLQGIDGPTAVAYADDEVMPAKVISEFAEDHDGRPAIKAGFVAGESMDIEGVERLAKVPGREELLSRLVGSAQSPIQGFVCVSSAIIRKFLYAVNAVRESRE